MNAIIQTPHFDRVAKEGVLFTNAFVTSPSCKLCRSSLLSGQYFFRTGLGAILVGAQWDAKIPSFPLLLKKSGYHIGQTYKVWSPGVPNDAPYGLSDGKQPTEEELIEATRATFPDMDSSPTKAWLVMNRDNGSAQGAKYFNRAFGKRPGEELYDLREDPDQLKNLAGEAGYAEMRKTLSTRLMGILKEAKDPRVLGDGSTFDKAPYTNLGKPRKKKKKK